MKQINFEESSDKHSSSKWKSGNDNYVYKSSSYRYMDSGSHYNEKNSAQKGIDHLDRYVDSGSHYNEKNSAQKGIDHLDRYVDSGSHYNEKNSAQKGIDQLDSLLWDLKNEREQTKSRDVLDSMTENKTIYRSNIGKLPSTTQSVNLIETTEHLEDISNKRNDKNKFDYEFETLAPYTHNVSQVKTITHNDKTLNSVRDLENLSLSGNILPVPGTKVTTTVRTYTYEIPPNSHLESYHTNLLNESQIKSLNYSHQTNNVPGTSVYKKSGYSTMSEDIGYPKPTNQTYELNEHFDSLTYNKNNIPIHPAPVDNLQRPYRTGPTTNVYYFKESTSSQPINLTPRNHEIVPRSNVPEPDFSVENVVKSQKLTQNYSTTTKMQQDHLNYQAAPPLFPVDATDYNLPNNDQPQKSEQLVENIPKTTRKREIETSVATTNNQFVPTVNKMGKEVYYPPKHELMLSESSRSAGYAAGGRYAKGSGMYEYESGSKSKTKSKSGGALIPVCLPLCCAMPCSIM